VVFHSWVLEPLAGLGGRPAVSHICQNRADMGHPAVVAAMEPKTIRHSKAEGVDVLLTGNRGAVMLLNQLPRRNPIPPATAFLFQ
jgi:hypothetical protein